MELLVVVVLMGIFATVAMARFGPTLFGDFGSQSDARRLSLALLQAQRMAILTGDNHYLDFTIDNGRAVGFQIFRRQSSGTTAADSYQAFSDQVSVTASHSTAEFTFEGQALAAYEFTLAGANRRWTVSVVPINGAVTVAASGSRLAEAARRAPHATVSMGNHTHDAPSSNRTAPRPVVVGGDRRVHDHRHGDGTGTADDA